MAPIHGSSSPSQRSRQGEDKPRFQGPALQTTHHCHRARSCLGPKHRRLIKVYSRFSPIITLNLRAGKHRAGSDLRGCSTASPAAVASAAPSHSNLFPPKKTCFSSPKESLPATTETRGEANPEPAPDRTDGGRGSESPCEAAGEPAGSGHGSREVWTQPRPHGLA